MKLYNLQVSSQQAQKVTSVLVIGSSVDVMPLYSSFRNYFWLIETSQ